MGYGCYLTLPKGGVTKYVELHCLPPTETVEVIGRKHKSLRKLRDEVTILKTEVRLLRRTFGQALENLAANYEELTPLVGLVAPPHIQGDDHMPNEADWNLPAIALSRRFLQQVKCIRAYHYHSAMFMQRLKWAKFWTQGRVSTWLLLKVWAPAPRCRVTVASEIHMMCIQNMGLMLVQNSFNRSSSDVRQIQVWKWTGHPLRVDRLLIIIWWFMSHLTSVSWWFSFGMKR